MDRLTNGHGLTKRLTEWLTEWQTKTRDQITATSAPVILGNAESRKGLIEKPRSLSLSGVLKTSFSFIDFFWIFTDRINKALNKKCLRDETCLFLKRAILWYLTRHTFFILFPKLVPLSTTAGSRALESWSYHHHLSPSKLFNCCTWNIFSTQPPEL